MKLAAKFLVTLIIILSASSVYATDLSFVEQAKFSPPTVRRPFALPIKTPRKDYAPRVPRCPAPRYLPSKPKLSNDNRGGNRKKFVPPQSPHR